MGFYHDCTEQNNYNVIILQLILEDLYSSKYPDIQARSWQILSTQLPIGYNS